jgi:uncharacterized protein (DUF1697 family)
MKYLALLRGINVGGNNIIKMTDLQKAFKDIGLNSVQTYIQSGNVIFESAETDKSLLTQEIESKLSTTFNYTSKIILIDNLQFKQIIEEAPIEFGFDQENYKYDFVFVKEPITSADVFTHIKVRDDVDKASCGTFALYFTRLTALSSRSYLTKLISLPIYKQLSIRNYNTTTKLYEIIKQV